MKTNRFLLTIFLFLAFSVCLPPTAMSADGDSDVRPGATNPVTTSRRTLFRDDEVLHIKVSPYAYEWGHMYAVPVNNDLASWRQYSESWPFNDLNAFNDADRRPIASARGRTADHGHDYAVYAFFIPNGDVIMAQYDPKALVDSGHGLAGNNLFPGSTRSSRSLDIALGDLDGLSDDDGWYHDEIVLVRTNDDGDVDVDVISHDKDLTSLAHDTIPYDVVGGAEHVSVDIGDLNGDGVLEIVVGMLTPYQEYHLAVYNYADIVGFKGLVKASTYNQIPELGDDFDLTVGDFNGDGKDEVIVAAGRGGLQIDLLQSDEDLNLDWKAHIINREGGISNTLRVVSGLFIYDPANGWTLSRRQAAVCYQDYDDIECKFFKVHTDQSFEIYDIAEIRPPYGWSFKGNDVEFTSMDITTGNFVGHGVYEKQTSPLMDLAVSYVEFNTDEYGNITKLRPAMKILSNVSGEFEQKWSWTGAEQDYDEEKRGSWQMATTVTAADGDGDTYRLGAPAHITMDNVLRLDHIIQEPPKHVDYLPINYTNPDGEWEVVNVSGYSDFAASFSYSSTKTKTTETTSTSSWDIGGGAELDVQATTVEGNMDIAGVKIRLETDTKLGYDYEENKSTYNSDYVSETYTESATTTTDDVLKGLVHTIDVWRYPIVGYYDDVDNENHPYGYQEIVMPGPALGFDGAGRAHPDWYQPFHENHNLLSYPLFANLADWTPADLGSFNVGDNNHKIVMNPQTVLTWGGDTSYEKYDWTLEAGEGSEKDYNNTLSESEEITASVKARAKLELGSDTIKATGKVSFHNSNSWGGSTVSKSTHSNTTGFSITLTQQDNPSSSGYDFMPSAYITDTGGAFKVAYAVGTGDHGWADWWKHHYGSKPDPALNLPQRLKWHQADQAHGNTEYWYLNPDDPGPQSIHSPAYKMRGFLMREFELKKDSDTQKPPLLSGMIVDGDIVLLCARVYNYSLSEDPTGPFDVKFYYYPLDTSDATPLPDTQPVSQSLMDATANLDGLETSGGTSREEVCVEWHTDGLSTRYEKDDGTYVNTFRFLVVLDEGDQLVDEIHELWDQKGEGRFAAGTNNIGTWPWAGAVTVAPRPGQPVVDLDLNDLSIAAGSMAVKTEQGIVGTDDKGGPLHLELGKTYEIRALVQADQDHPFHRLLFLYDGDPDGKDKGKRKGHPAGKGKGNPDGKGKVIGSTKVYGIEAKSQYAWVRWTPDTLGKQEIWMRLLEDSDEVNPGNAIDSLEVIVVPAKKSKQQPKKSK